jgi:hypothetical protein
LYSGLFSIRSTHINPKEKGKKESAFRGAGFENARFLEKIISSDNGVKALCENFECDM